MKKLFKIGCVVLTIVLLLSLAGCPSPNSPNNPEFDPSVGTWITGETPDPNVEGNSIFVRVNKDSDTHTSLIFSCYGSKFLAEVIYKRTDAFASETWFSEARIESSTFLLNEPRLNQEKNNRFLISSQETIPKSQLLNQLPSSGDWVVHMISDKDATRNIHFTIPADKAEKVRKWIMNQ